MRCLAAFELWPRRCTPAEAGRAGQSRRHYDIAGFTAYDAAPVEERHRHRRAGPRDVIRSATGATVTGVVSEVRRSPFELAVPVAYSGSAIPFGTAVPLFTMPALTRNWAYDVMKDGRRSSIRPGS